jgi:hypothetical protein
MILKKWFRHYAITVPVPYKLPVRRPQMNGSGAGSDTDIFHIDYQRRPRLVLKVAFRAYFEHGSL